MKMYIPEITDHIVLTEDWNFQLHAEGRNEALAKFFGYNHYYHMGSKWVSEKKSIEAPIANYNLILPNYDDYKGLFGKVNYKAYEQAGKDARDNNKEYQQYLVDIENYNTHMKNGIVEVIDVTLPKGTVLSVDRIYIRKGASDFSSITFYAKNLGEVLITSPYAWNQKVRKIKSPRFWAKLSDCNNIQFEQTDKIK